MSGRHLKARAQGAATTYRVARLLSVPRHYAAWGAIRYLLTGRSGNIKLGPSKTIKIEDKQWRVTP